VRLNQFDLAAKRIENDWEHDRHGTGRLRQCPWQCKTNVRFGSKADMCAAKRHVRFTPNSDRESVIPQKAMSALPSKADMCGATDYVCFGPKADIGNFNFRDRDKLMPITSKNS
jgi:hypothetical protein